MSDSGNETTPSGGERPRASVGVRLFRIAIGVVVAINLVRILLAASDPENRDSVVGALLVGALVVAVVLGAVYLRGRARMRALASRYPYATLVPILTTPSLAQAARIVANARGVSGGGYATVVVEPDRTIRLFTGGADPIERVAVPYGAVKYVGPVWVPSGMRTLRGIEFVIDAGEAFGRIAVHVAPLRADSWWPGPLSETALDALIAELQYRVVAQSSGATDSV